MDIQAKRVYAPIERTDGTRVLVDRVWPRGISRGKTGAKLWLREAAPTTALRKWFGHDRCRWEEFRRRYPAELDGKPETVRELLELAAQGRVTLLYSARDEGCNQAVALGEYLMSRAKGRQAT
ncbi:MAG: DUF488 family protein [Acidobacteria bacterium]|nr:DUF488 family protein [Acidobacteriota bacterium]